MRNTICTQTFSGRNKKKNPEVEGMQSKNEKQKWKEGSEVKEEFPACKMEDVHFFRDGRGKFGEQRAARTKCEELSKPSMYKRHAKNDRSIKGLQEGHL